MSLPRSVSEVLKGHVTLEVEGIDRMYLNVYVPQLQREQGVVNFLRYHRGHPIASSALLAPISDAFIQSIEAFVDAQGVPLLSFAKSQRKDDVTAEFLAKYEQAEGLLYVGKAQEKTPVFRTEKRRNPETGQTYPWIVRSTAMVNHYSKWRGINRFPALTMTFDLLYERPEVQRRHAKLSGLAGVRDWIKRETKLSNPTLKTEVAKTRDADLAQALEWSEAVNATIGRVVHDVPPFPFVREALECMRGKADVMVVSATPGEALDREWEEHGLKPNVALIAGQELGSKKEHLAIAAVGKYPPHRILMIGDAPGDQNAATDNGVLFYPIDPGHEDDSWQRFFEEALPRFLSENYAGPYMDAQVARFQALLPDRPPWRSS